MPKKKPEPDVLQRFEGALRKALATPPDAPRARAKPRKKKKASK
jgi:hypothetical protein